MDILHIVLGCSWPWYSNSPFGRTAAFTFQQDLYAFTHWNPLQGLVDAGGLIIDHGWSTNIGGLGWCFTHVEIYWTTPQPICSSDPTVTIRHEVSLSSYLCLSLAIIMEPSSTSLLTPDENLAGAPLSVGLKIGEEFEPGNAMKCVLSIIILDSYSHFRWSIPGVGTGFYSEAPVEPWL